MNSGFSYLTQQQENKWIFYAAGNSWQVWEKPDGCNFIHIVVIGAGGGGGGGYQRAAAANGGGGGGGSNGSINTMMIPAYTVPDKLHIQVGVGGAGGANLVNGNFSTSTYITLIPIISVSNVLLTVTPALFGNAGSVTGGLGAGAGGGSGIAYFLGWGKINLNIVPAVGGYPGTSSVNGESNRIVWGGAGGSFAAASTEVAGRSITSSYKQPSAVTYSVGQALGVSGKAGNGPNLISTQPQFFGGAGGAAITTTNTVNGGDGAIGCGGGGAGVNLTGGSSTGGRGGDGMVIITCW